MVDFGLDVSTYPDLDPTFAWTSGITVVAQAIARRLETRRGGLEYDPEYGFDLRQYVADDLSPADVLQLQSDIRDEIEKEERVLEAQVVATQSLSTQTLTVAIALRLAETEFTLTLKIDAVSAAVLGFGQ